MPIAVRRSALLASSALVVLSLAACTGSAGGAAPGSGATSAAPATSTATTPSTATTATPKAGITAAQAEAALLVAAEVGPGFRVKANSVTPTSLPCAPNSASMDKLVAPVVSAGRSFASAAGDIEISEEIANYGDKATVSRALDAAQKGLACTSGVLGHIPVSVRGPTNLTKGVTTANDGVAAWTVASTVARESLVICKIDTQLVVITFGETPTAADRSLDAKDIVQTAIRKVGAATQ